MANTTKAKGRQETIYTHDGGKRQPVGTRLKLIKHDETEEVELDMMHKRLMTHKIKQEVTNDM